MSEKTPLHTRVGEALGVVGGIACGAMMLLWVVYAWLPAEMPRNVYQGSGGTFVLGFIAIIVGSILAST